jgi:hypothetical protein
MEENRVAKSAVWYSFIRTDGSRGANRIFIDEEIKSSEDVIRIEAGIMQTANGAYAAVMITNWRSVEG